MWGCAPNGARLSCGALKKDSSSTRAGSFKGLLGGMPDLILVDPGRAAR